ncbi:ribonuclease BN [Intrasporangium oryzae NRRL B-24470]|uniref:Ribonuclease BN n=1 Tax=Intrasporangium oryzae NRRL B-24470 TaxID=1386089 RepID=W9GBL3_9MICO|nr:YihY/virulence factor BrkB family protein [Intrasporangium oryzae]EWT03460.1 ribonuclease BN [Intrasporangium oryzae NRRL B-24470]
MAAHGDTLTHDHPGARATEPTQIPRRGWLQVSRRAWAEAKRDQVPLLAAGVAFFAFLSLFPAMIAAAMLYGLVASPQTVADQSRQLAGVLPRDAASLVIGQMHSITSRPTHSLGLGLVVALVLALWSASGGVGNLITAVNVSYDEDETRGFVRRKALALALTLGAILFLAVTLSLIAVAPAVFDAVGASGPVRTALQGVRWLLLVVAVAVALALLYRWAPDRHAARFSWVSVGAVVATVIWVVASLGFAFYANTFGSYNKTYGALAGVVVLMLWLWITAFVTLLGAEINAEAEQQTIRDTTRGPEAALGRRGAVKADTGPDETHAGA